MEGSDNLVRRLEASEGRGSREGSSEAHQSHLISASVLEPDVVPTLPPSQSPAAWALEKSRAFSTFLLSPKPKASSPAPVTYGGPYAPFLGRAASL